MQVYRFDIFDKAGGELRQEDHTFVTDADAIASARKIVGAWEVQVWQGHRHVNMLAEPACAIDPDVSPYLLARRRA